MKITKNWLTKNNACPVGKEWFISQGITTAKAGIQNLITNEKLQWANWLLVRVLTHKQRIAYSIFAAEQTISIYEKKFPNDNRLRLAIESARIVLKRDTVVNRSAAWSAAWSAESAQSAAWSAARSAAWSAESARSAAESAAWSAEREMLLRILNYGLSFLKGDL